MCSNIAPSPYECDLLGKGVLPMSSRCSPAGLGCPLSNDWGPYEKRGIWTWTQRKRSCAHKGRMESRGAQNPQELKEVGKIPLEGCGQCTQMPSPGKGHGAALFSLANCQKFKNLDSQGWLAYETMGTPTLLHSGIFLHFVNPS